MTASTPQPGIGAMRPGLVQKPRLLHPTEAAGLFGGSVGGQLAGAQQIVEVVERRGVEGVV